MSERTFEIVLDTTFPSRRQALLSAELLTAMFTDPQRPLEFVVREKEKESA